MQTAGWNLGVEKWENDAPFVASECRRGANWFGWSHSATVGTVSNPLRGGGEATLDFGNCWSGGEVGVYLSDEEVASAHNNTPSKVVTFAFQDGDVLKLRGEGPNSVITINDIKFRCSKGRN